MTFVRKDEVKLKTWLDGASLARHQSGVHVSYCAENRRLANGVFLIRVSELFS